MFLIGTSLPTAPMSLADSAREPRGIRRDEDHVDVVGQLAVGPDLDLGFPTLLHQQLAVELVVERPEEGRLPSVSTLGHVVGYAWDHDSRMSRHTSRDGIDGES